MHLKAFSPARATRMILAIGLATICRGHVLLLSDCHATPLPNSELPRGQVEKVTSSNLRAIFSEEVEPSKRFTLVHSLGGDLTSVERSSIYSFLKTGTCRDQKNLLALQLVKNELMNVLIDQSAFPTQVVSELIEICQDQRQDFVTRDYAVQHLVTCYERCGTVITEMARRAIRENLWAVAGTKTSTAGTALLGLHRLAMIDARFDRSKIARRAVDMTASRSISTAARITAIQVCSEEKVSESLAFIRPLVFPGNPTAVRISAIAALGQLGTEDDLQALEKIKASPSDGLEVAIQSAMIQLQQRVHGQKLAFNYN